MDDYRKQVERARLARMQGMRSLDKDPGGSSNRIEDMLMHRSLSENRSYEPIYEPEVVRRTHIEESRGTEKPSRSYKRILRNIFYTLLLIVVLPIIGFGGYTMFQQYENGKDTSKSVIEEVGKLVALPVGEEPTVATISDLTPLQDQPFFKDARIGDKVIIYKEAKKAILYRPVQKKIITVAPLAE